MIPEDAVTVELITDISDCGADFKRGNKGYIKKKTNIKLVLPID